MDTNRVTQLLDSVASFDRSLLDNSSSQTPQAREAISKLRRDVEKLDQTLADPEAKFWLTLRKSALLSPIKIAQDLGLFRLIQERKPITSAELSKETGAEEGLIVRILRILTAEGLVDEVDVQTYAPLPAGQPFANKHNEDTVSWAMLFLPIALENPAYWASLKYQSTPSASQNEQENGPVSKTNGHADKAEHYANPFEFHFKRPGYGLFDWTRENLDIQAIFASSMQAARAGHRAKNDNDNAFPYAKVLAGQDSEVAIVDVAGGHGQALKEIKESVKGQDIKGRWILQDLQAALDEMKEPLEGIEVMPSDIFGEQPVKGAAIYHLRRVLHDWDDNKSVDILKLVVAAMDQQKSTLLIVDAVLPNQDVSLIDALSDHSMMVFGGRERSKRQWEELAEAAGLRIANIWQGAEKEATIECYKA